MMNSSIQAFLQIISFLLPIGVTVLQLYVTGRIAKIKEDILTIVRHELKEELKELENEMVTKEVLHLTREKLELMMTNILDRIDKIK